MANTKRIHRRAYPTLLAWRTAHGMSQREAAEYLGILQAAYARYELGKRTPRREALKRILALTTVPLESLVRVA